MVAGVITALGVPLGKDLANNIEDPDFNPDYQKIRGEEFQRHLNDVIATRNEEYGDWGWKYPRAARYIERVCGSLRNPHFVIVIRDPVPASLRALASGKPNPLEAVMKRMDIDHRNLQIAQNLKVPCLLVSYERAVSNPSNCVREMADFLGCEMPANVARIISFMSPGSYKNPPEPSSE